MIFSLQKGAKPRAVSDVIRFYRLKKKLTQTQLGIRLDTGREYISMLESGKAYPSLVQFIRIALALEVSPGEMVETLVQFLEKDNTTP